jgi:hypothetical protein
MVVGKIQGVVQSEDQRTADHRTDHIAAFRTGNKRKDQV